MSGEDIIEFKGAFSIVLDDGKDLTVYCDPYLYRTTTPLKDAKKHRVPLDSSKALTITVPRTIGHVCKRNGKLVVNLSIATDLFLQIRKNEIEIYSDTRER